ncbi:LysR family transcriptional regulator [Paraburkholderia caribensis]|uniref:LysR family transcriptional regulator n=1 Tax=Paraburkholderia caribensis TaxID=75105 RepID=A0ABV0EA01_9BURK|nr:MULTISPECIES: LysR family transcriptional regulator [Paraburkholderia]MCO4880462.1 LysR family transcriptional regulator [Paraburkholderia caribensis]
MKISKYRHRRGDEFARKFPDGIEQSHRRGNDLNFLYLETFAAVVGHRHFTRAGAALNISRGAASRRVKVLEETLGALLVSREPPLTPTGARKMIPRIRTFQHTSRPRFAT